MNRENKKERGSRLRMLIAGVLLLCVALCGCSSKEPAESGQDAKQTEPTVLQVVLDWYPNAIHTFLYEAIEHGYFAEEGLQVELISPAESVDAVNFVAAGRAQIGLTYPVDIIKAREADMPVISIGAVSQKALDCMCALASNDAITADLSGLKGKTIGYAGTQISKAVVDTVTAGAGLSEGDFELLNVGFDLVTSLTTENADLVVGTFINDEIVTMQNMGYDLQVFMEQDYGVPELYGLVFAVNEEDYAARTDVYHAFLAACEKGFADMKASEEDAMKLIMEQMNSADNPLDEVQQKESYEILLPRMETSQEPFLSMKEERWQEIIDWMVQTGQIAETIEASEVIRIQK